jgi:winged helix DNA-binding protein
VMSEDFRKTVIAKNGDVQQTFMVDGFVAGTWRHEDDRVLLDPFEPLPRNARLELEDEAARLAAWLR